MFKVSEEDIRPDIITQAVATLWFCRHEILLLLLLLLQSKKKCFIAIIFLYFCYISVWINKGERLRKGFKQKREEEKDEGEEEEEMDHNKLAPWPVLSAVGLVSLLWSRLVF